jgi:hypothetical protein
MDAMQAMHGCGQIYSRSQSGRDSVSALSSLTVVAAFLDAASRMWGDDRIQAKSPVKIATAMLRGFTDEPPAEAKKGTAPSDTRALAPWQTRKVKQFIDASLDTTVRLRVPEGPAMLPQPERTSPFMSASAADIGRSS